jgi:hypothetical protein
MKNSKPSRRRAFGAVVLTAALFGGSVVAWSWAASRVSVSAAEIPVRGASMPYTTYEAENGVAGGGAQIVGPNRTIGDVAGEASGRRAVALKRSGAFVEWTTKAPADALVARFSIPDGPDSSLNVYVNGKKVAALRLTPKFAWLYGDETAPVNTPSAGSPRHIYDEANLRLPATVPAGSTIKLRKDADNPGDIAVDFIDLEQAGKIENPDPSRYAVPAGFAQRDVQAALDRARTDPGLTGVYLPPGDYPTTGKFQVYGRKIRVVGAGPWFTRFRAPENQQNTDVGMTVQSSAGGSLFSGFAYFGNYRIRQDGPGKVFDLQNVSNLTIDNIWTEHQVVFFWGQNTDNTVIRNSRIRDTFADGINMTNGSSGNRVVNNDARSTGDDSFALFAATDAGGGNQTGNLFENLSARLSWRAAGLAVYGGYGNTFRNIYLADTLTYSGLTVSSLDFGIAMKGFGTAAPTQFDGVTIVRAGGHFYGDQTFPAVWVFAASKEFQAIRLANVDIVQPTYAGVRFQSAQNPVLDTVFTNLTVAGAHRSGDRYDASSGFGILVPGSTQGQVVFVNARFSDNVINAQNNSKLFKLLSETGGIVG